MVTEIKIKFFLLCQLLSERVTEFEKGAFQMQVNVSI